MAHVDKTDKKVIPPKAQANGAENNAAATPQDAAGGTQTAPENPEQSGGDATQQKDTGLDKGSEEAAVGKKRISETQAGEARKIFKKFSAEELYFTSDGFGFLSQKEAEQHAASLKEQGIVKIDKKDVE